MSETLLTEQELHNLAMNIVGKALQNDLGWEFLLVNSKLRKDPQFVCVDKDKKKHFIIVRAVAEDTDPDIHDREFMQKVKKHADKFDAKAYYAGVGLYNAEDPNRPLRKGEPYQIHFKGLLPI